MPLKDKGFKVIWSDGVSCSKDDDEKPRKVLFLPQKYLGSKVYQGEGGSDSAINQFITDLLEENENFNSAQEVFEKIKMEKTRVIGDLIGQLLLTQSNIKSYSEDLKKYTEKEDLEKEIEKKNKKLKEMKKSVNLSDDELETYKKLTKDKSDIEINIFQYKEDVKLYKTLAENNVFDISEILDYGFSKIEEEK